MRNTEARKKIFITGISILYACLLYAQTPAKNISFKDSLDHRFDLSDYVIDANGFIPIPLVITEPALGGFGGALIPVFIKKRPPYLDTINGKAKYTPIAPDVTGGIAAYTLNNTWILMGFRSGTLVKSRIKYLIGGGLANVNMSFYRNVDQSGEKELAFNIQTIPGIVQATKRIGYSHWYAGLKYMFLQTKVKYKGEAQWSDYADSLELKSIVSQPGIVVELDNRDNTFTPNSGIKFHVDANWSDDFFGSDHEFGRFNYYTYMYKNLSKKIVGGLRIDGQQVTGTPPFYMLPYIDLRGIPIYRYQGRADILSELEMRWDFTSRWSMMLFSGTGKAFDDWKDFGDADWVVSYGTGFRYLLARKFKLRGGIDVAKGPESWAYYIVFGSNWVK